MARPRGPVDLKGEGPELLKRLKKEKAGWKRERLLAIKRVLEEVPTLAVSEELGRSENTVQSWINKFRTGGIENLLTKKKGKGPKSLLTPEMERAMTEQLELGKWRTGRDAWVWLSENYDVSDLKESVIYKYLGKCEGRLKATRPCNPEKDPVAEANFRTTLAEKMAEFELPENQEVKLWVYDEMRYGLNPLTRKMWCRKGVRAIAPSKRRYQNGYLYGALEVGGEGAEFLFTPSLNKQWDLGFLKQLSRSSPDAIHIVIGDGAGFHHKGPDEALPTNIRIITLPAYCPELNPAEKLWDIVKDGICNQLWPDLDKLEDAITQKIRPYWEDATKVVSLIGDGYLLSELNATNRRGLPNYNC